MWKEWHDFARHYAFWQNHEEKGLLKAEYVRDYVLRLWFEEELDVSIYDLDFYPLVVQENPGGVFRPLRDKERFRFVEGRYALMWFNPETGSYFDPAIDIAPECIRFFAEKHGTLLKGAAQKAVTS